MDYVIYSLSRSGHHAFCEWIIKNVNCNFLYSNNAVVGWDRKLMQPFSNEVKHYEKGSSLSKNIYSIETFDVDYINEYDLLNFGQKYNILFLRSFKNWVASCFKNGGNGKYELTNTFVDQLGNRKENTISLWRKRANVFLNNEFPDLLCVYYDIWFTNENYRKDIADKLDLDTNIFNDCMSVYGGGSSFSKLNNKKVDIQVLDRYSLLSNDLEYLKIIDDNHDLVLMDEKIKNEILHNYPSSHTN